LTTGKIPKQQQFGELKEESGYTSANLTYLGSVESKLAYEQRVPFLAYKRCRSKRRAESRRGGGYYSCMTVIT
jgi:hypothetical protein